jgi:hypothetical protein
MPMDRQFSATRQGWSAGIGGCHASMKHCLWLLPMVAIMSIESIQLRSFHKTTSEELEAALQAPEEQQAEIFPRGCSH